MKIHLLLLAFVPMSLKLFSQRTIQVTEQTIKIGGTKEEELLFGFAKGDKIIFSFSEVKGKELKEVEITEYPSNSKFSDFKTKNIEDKIIDVVKQGVYVFRFKNSALSARVCKISIQRIPKDESTINFNTSVEWIVKQDTTWNTFTKDVVVGYDTVYEQKTKKELVSSIQKEELVMDKIQRVHSVTNGNGNKTFVFFTLPRNRHEENRSSRVISWVFWVGVGEEANKAWQQNAKAIKSFATTSAAKLMTPMGALAVGLISELLTPKLGEDVKYSLVDEQNKNLFMAGIQYKGWDHGKGVAGYKKFSDPVLCQGTFFIVMSNDNFRQGIDVNVKVAAIMEIKEYKDVAYTETIVTPRHEKQLLREPKINSYRAPVTGL